MDIYNENLNYGLFCLNHSKQYNGKTIDKITFTVPMLCFRKNIFNFSEKISNSVFYIEYCQNEYFKLHIHGEYINPEIPMLYSILKIFHQISISQIFLEEINLKIRKILEKDKNLKDKSIEFLRFFNNMGFKFSELELAFDFFNCLPCDETSIKSLNHFKNSYYSNDYKPIFRNEFLYDDSFGKVKNGVRDSIFVIYNRGKKINIKENVWRVEFRLRGIRSYRLLDLTDLHLNMDDFIYLKGNRLNRIYNYWVDNINFNWEYIKYHFPIFSVLIKGKLR